MVHENNNQSIKRVYFLTAIIIGIILAISLISIDNAKASSEKKAYKKYFKQLDHKIKVPFVDGYSSSNMVEDGDCVYWKPNWKAKKKKISLKQFKYYKYIKLTDENKYDLLLSNSKDAQGDGHVLICRYIKGKVKPIFCVYGLRIGIYKTKDKQIVFYFGGSSIGQMVFNKIKGKHLKHSSVYSFTRVKNQTPYYNVYYKGSKKIEESEYREANATLGKALKFKKIKKKKSKKISKKAYKFLKGIWVSVGNSRGTKMIFTRTHIKQYNLWTDDYKVLSPKNKGKYVGKRRIVYAKKKGKKWIIKVGEKGNYTYYKSRDKDLLDCCWKEKGEWRYSGTSSLTRYK